MASSSRIALLAVPLAALAACSGGGSSGTTNPPVQPRDHTVQLSWAANHERGVNSPGGGYRVSLTGKPDLDVPYVSGATAPTSVTATLYTGTYTMTVRAYQALDASGGTSRTESAPSTTTVVVP